MAPSLLARTSTDPLGGGISAPETLHTNPALFAGIGVAIAAVLVCGIWVCIHLLLKRRRSRRERDEREREEQRRLAGKSMLKGKLDEIPVAGDAPPAPRRRGGAKAVDRSLLTASVVLPEKALTPRLPAHQQRDYSAIEAALKIPLPPILLQPPSSDSVAVVPRPRHTRQSSSRTVSFISKSSPLRNSVNSAASSHGSAFEDGYMRKVHQVFHRTLPDELVVALGEHLAVVEGFDDGWCVVGRENKARLGAIEFGTVPGWVFIKPEKGARPPPMPRKSSLGVTVKLESPGGPSFSWTNA